MNLTQVLKSKMIRLIVSITVVDIVFFSNISAQNANTAEIILGFSLFLVSNYAICRILVRTLSIYGLPIKNVKRLSVYLSVFVGLIIALQSIGELTIKDAIILLPLSYLSYTYYSFLKRSSQQID
jgi:hypothetical protein